MEHSRVASGDRECALGASQLALSTAIPPDSSTPKTMAATSRLPPASHSTKNTAHATSRNPADSSRLDLPLARFECSSASFLRGSPNCFLPLIREQLDC